MKYSSLPAYCFPNPPKDQDRPAQPQQSLKEVLKYQSLTDKRAAALMGEYNTWYKSGTAYGINRELLFKHEHRILPVDHCGYTNLVEESEDSEDSESPFKRPVAKSDPSEICIFFCRGYCVKASSCRYAHRLPLESSKNPFPKIEKNTSKTLRISNFIEDDIMKRATSVCEEYGSIEKIVYNQTKKEIEVEYTHLSSAIFAKVALHGCNFDLEGENLIIHYVNEGKAKARRD